MGGEDEDSLAYSPTWVVAAVCTLIIAISLSVERLMHFTGSYLKRKNKRPLYEALHKVEEELMLLGFISLLLAVFQDRISKICMPPKSMRQMLPCTASPEKVAVEAEMAPVYPGAEFHNQPAPPPMLRFHGEGATYCAKKNKVPILSVEALHHLHIFIFVLATVHVTSTLLTIIFGGVKIRQWMIWEDEIAKSSYENLSGVTDVQQHDFIKSRFKGIGKRSAIVGWLHSFAKQFYGSVTKTDYMALRLGFIMLVLAVGTKLQHVIIQLAHEVAEKHAAIEGELVVQPSDDHFWFHRPRIILYFLHFILFQNAFEIAFFFLIWGYHSDTLQLQHIATVCHCYTGKFCNLHQTIPEQLLSILSFVDLWDVQMGTHFKQSIFEDHIRASLVDWAQTAKRKHEEKAAAMADSSAAANATPNAGDEGSSSTATGVQMGEIRPANQDQTAIDIRHA
nr:MLO-like protein 1 [Ipomoea batatas]